MANDEWSSPVSVSGNLELRALHPEVSVDSNGVSHVVWSQETENGTDIFYASCDGGVCLDPILLSDQNNLICDGDESLELGGANDWPVIANNGNNELMVMWSNAGGVLVYSTWEIGQIPPTTPAGCFAGPEINPDPFAHIHPRLSGESES